jgi:hypothetical protein
MNTQACLCTLNVGESRCHIERESNEHRGIPGCLCPGCVMFGHVNWVRKISSTAQESAGLSVSKWAWSRSILEAWQYRYWIVRHDSAWNLLLGFDLQQAALERFNARHREVWDQFRLSLRH